MRTIETCVINAKYIYDTEKKALCAYEPKKVFWTSGHAHIWAKVGGEDQEFDEYDFKRFYDSEFDFKNSNHKRDKHILADERAFIFADGKAIEVNTDDAITEAYWDADTHAITHNGGKFYESADDAFAHNEYDFIDENGKVTHKVGMYKKFELTLQQKALIAEFEELTQRMNREGLLIGMDEDENMFAFNRAHVEDWSSDGGCNSIDAWKVCVDVNVANCIGKWYELYFDLKD